MSVYVVFIFTARAERVRLQNEAKSRQSSIKPIKQQQTTMSTGLVSLPRERFNPPSQNNSQERNYFMPQTLSTSPENNFNPGKAQYSSYL